MRKFTPTDRTLFLQTETTGASLWYDRLTMIGWSLGGRYEIAFPGSGDARFLAALASADSVVTFDGPRLDDPFLKKQYPSLVFPASRIDLRPLLRKKYGAGAANIPSARAHRTDYGPTLWYGYRAGDTDALRQLIENNYTAIQRLKAMLGDVLDLPTPSSTPIGLDHWVQNAPPPEQVFTHGQIGLDPRIRVVGIDLTGSEARPSGWCLIEGAHAETRRIRTDDEMVRRIIDARPALVSLDAPLSLPAGRLSVDDADPTRVQFGITRACERALRQRGVGVYPPLLPSMQALTARGIALANRLRTLGFPVIEGFPGAAQDILGIPRKKASREYLRDGLARFGITGDFQNGRVSHDELDAITVAIVGQFFLAGRYEALGDEEEGCLIVPDLGESAKTVLQSMQNTKTDIGP